MIQFFDDIAIHRYKISILVFTSIVVTVYISICESRNYFFAKSLLYTQSCSTKLLTFSLLLFAEKQH